MYQLERVALIWRAWLGRVRHLPDWSETNSGQRPTLHRRLIDAVDLPLLALRTLCSEAEGVQERPSGHWVSSLGLRNLGRPDDPSSPKS